MVGNSEILNRNFDLRSAINSSQVGGPKGIFGRGDAFVFGDLNAETVRESESD